MDESLPRRTRGHIIADLSVNHVQRFVLQEGHVADRDVTDYGYDLIVRTFDAEGFPEPERFYVQLKATDAIATYEQPSHDRFAFIVEARHARLWGREPMPVFFVLFDARRCRAYWLDIHGFLATRSPLRPGAKSITLHIPKKNVLRRSTIRKMRRRKAERVKG